MPRILVASPLSVVCLDRACIVILCDTQVPFSIVGNALRDRKCQGHLRLPVRALHIECTVLELYK
jgi:hypothetical protein